MISETYSQSVFEDLVKTRYLDHGISPTSNQLDALIGQAAGQMLGASGSNVVFEPEIDTESSAAQIQESLATFSREILTIIKSSITLKNDAKRLFDWAENKVSLLNKQVCDLALQSCALAQGRSLGLPLFVSDSFVDLTHIDQQLSSTQVDPRTHAVTLKLRPNEHRIDLSRLQDTDFDIFVTEGDVAGQNIAPGSSLSDAVDDSDSYWMQRVYSLSIGRKGIAFQVDMKQPIPISRIVFSPFGANTETGLEIRVLASENSISWRELLPRTIQTAPQVEINGSAVLARFIRIEMVKTKPSYPTEDTNGYIYEFGLNNLHVYESKRYLFGQFVSKPLVFLDVLGIPKSVNKLRINVYEEKPDGTEITYYISTDPDSPGGLIRVLPDTIIDLATTSEKRENRGKIQSRYDANHSLIDLPIRATSETIRFFRNTYQEGVLIDGVQAGWTYQNSYYNCVFEIIDSLEINLGINFAYLDGKQIHGIQTIDPGFHIFRTHETNWRYATSESLDPLFPYNHKFLIEGMRGSKVYIGANFIAARELNLVSAFDLINNIPNGDEDFFGIYGIYPIVKIPKPPVFFSGIEGWRLEQYAVRYKYTSEVTPPVTSIRLISKLSTSSPRLTPVFKGYIIMGGY